jgi:hypothetical protein
LFIDSIVCTDYLPVSVVAIDINNDDKQDFVVTSGLSFFTTYLNISNGEFADERLLAIAA